MAEPQPAPGGSNGWFGETWNAPMCDPTMHVETPVGSLCLQCEEEIGERDRGVTMPYLGLGANVHQAAVHLECHLRSILGGALCADGTCQNCGDGTGGAISDPPGLTAREAAIAAVAAHERKDGRFKGA